VPAPLGSALPVVVAEELRLFSVGPGVNVVLVLLPVGAIFVAESSAERLFGCCARASATIALGARLTPATARTVAMAAAPVDDCMPIRLLMVYDPQSGVAEPATSSAMIMASPRVRKRAAAHLDDASPGRRVASSILEMECGPFLLGRSKLD